jgi:hypothetical protein
VSTTVTTTCPCGCGRVFRDVVCSSCGRAWAPGVLGPDERCPVCWEAEMAPSERHLETTRLMRRALDAWAGRYGDHRAGVWYPSTPWARRRFVAYAREHGGELSAAVEATGPRVLLRRVTRVLRLATEVQPCSP